jgi:phage gp36-like protein
VSFAVLADLEARYGAQEILLLADRDGDQVVDPGVVEAHLRDADAEIVSELAGTVAIDPANPPLNLVRIACQIARYRLYGANPPEAARNDYTDAIKFLRLVRSGQASLDGGSAAPVAAAEPIRAAATEPGTRIFTRGL